MRHPAQVGLAAGVTSALELRRISPPGNPAERGVPELQVLSENTLRWRQRCHNLRSRRAQPGGVI